MNSSTLSFGNLFRCLFFLLLCVPTLLLAKSYNPDNIPFPKPGVYPYYTSNPDGILNDSTVARIENKLALLDDSVGVKAWVVVVERVDGGDLFSFSLNSARKYKVGEKTTDGGIVIALSTLDREYRILTSGGIEGTLPDAVCSSVERRVMVPLLKESRWNEAVACTIDTLTQIMLGDQDLANNYSEVKAVRNEDPWWISVLAFPFAVGLFVLLFWSIFKLFFIVPNTIYLFIHKSKDVEYKHHGWKTVLFLKFRDSLWRTGNDYYYLDEHNNKKFFFFSSDSYSGYSGSSSGGYSGSSSGGYSSRSSSGGSHSSRSSSGGGSSFRGGGSGGRF